jgi:alpha-beta hydrolase superfamily lysophospholipase
LKTILFRILIAACQLLVVSNAFAMKPYKDFLKTPADYQCQYDTVKFVTKDNVTLAGWYIHSEDPASMKPSIIVSYGDAGNMSYFLDYAVEFSKNGYGVLLFDYRGFGRSDPFSIDRDMLIYREFLIDLNAAVDYVKENYNSRIVLFGHSMGATLSIGVAGNRKDILAVISEGPCDNTNECLKRINATEKKYDNPRIFKNESVLPIGFEPQDAIQKFTHTAFYVFTGSSDEIVSADVIYELYSACPSPIKSMWIAPGTDHSNIIASQTEQYFNNIYVFLEQVLKAE